MNPCIPNPKVRQKPTQLFFGISAAPLFDFKSRGLQQANPGVAVGALAIVAGPASGAAEKWIARTHQASYRSAMQIVVTLDCVDTEAQANFWLAALAPLDYQRGFHGPPYLSLVGPAPAPTLLLQHVPEPKQGKNRMHLDLDFGTTDLVSEVSRLERLGAARLSEELSEHGFRWIVVADPEGNEFCVFNPPHNINAAE